MADETLVPGSTKVSLTQVLATLEVDVVNANLNPIKINSVLVDPAIAADNNKILFYTHTGTVLGYIDVLALIVQVLAPTVLEDGFALTYNDTTGLMELSAAGTGDVVGPASAINENIAVFDLTTGKLIKDGLISKADVIANTAKVTNATHTGEVTGATALTLDKTAITNKTTVVPLAGDFVLFSDTSDAGNLKKLDVSTLLGGGSGDVVGPASAISENIAVFDLTTGKLIKDGLISKADVIANTAKVTNATHTGEITGSGALTLDKTSITNKTTVVPLAGDFVLFSDSSDTGNLKKLDVSTLLGSGVETKKDNAQVLASSTSLDFKGGSLITDDTGGVTGIALNTRGVATKTNIDYTATLADNILLFSTGSVDRTLTLPTAASATNIQYTIKKLDSGIGKIIVDGNLAETIDGAITRDIINQYDSITIISDGTEWWVI